MVSGLQLRKLVFREVKSLPQDLTTSRQALEFKLILFSLYCVYLVPGGLLWK